jgi:hypothetical protein
MPSKKKAAKKSKALKVTKAPRRRAPRKLSLLNLLPLFGKYWKGQGGVPYDIEFDAAGKPEFIVVAASDKKGNLTEVNGAYGAAGTEIGANSYRDCAANTKKMLAAGSPLAKAATSLRNDGHADFVVASQCAVNVLRAKLPELTKGLGWIQSSTEYSAYYAWCQDFNYGGQNTSHKGNERRAFAVRRVPVSVLR